MAYFPFFTDLTGKPGLIVGGGAVALRKIEKLLPFSPQLSVIAEHICPEIRRIPGLTCLERPFAPGDEAGSFFVIAATDSREVNRQVSGLCRAGNIPVNVADDAELCTFLFPALIRRGSLTVGISTGGASPTAAACLREQAEQLLPERTEDILDFLHAERETLRAEIPEAAERRELLRKLFFAAMEAGRPLTEAETARLCRKGKEADRP